MSEKWPSGGMGSAEMRVPAAPPRGRRPRTCTLWGLVLPVRGTRAILLRCQFVGCPPKISKLLEVK